MTSNQKKKQQVDPFQRLAIIVKTLRGSHGCPWDQKQTAYSLIKYLREETEELAQAIEAGEPGHICEETGDLYFILALLTTIFEEQEDFSASDALTGICNKMIRRHPHVFEPGATCSEEQLQTQWERIKQQEKNLLNG
jgi:uncharacterized protein YabN with tetrapyrrole methylase and pyrophosphatase domain